MPAESPLPVESPPIDATLMENLPAQASALLDHAGTLGQVMLIVGLIVGLVLLILGRKIARPACAISGLVLGGLAAAAVLQEIGRPQWLLFGVAGGGLVCFVLVWALFRVWMGVTCAALLALVAPAAAVVWQGQAPDVSQLQSPTVSVDPESVATVEGKEELRQQIQDAYQQQKEQLTGIWDGMSGGARKMVIVSAGVGAIAGLLIGLIFPYTAATLESALVGSTLLFFCAVGLAYAYLPDQMAGLPELGPRWPIAIIGLITVLAMGIQWALSRRRADK